MERERTTGLSKHVVSVKRVSASLLLVKYLDSLSECPRAGKRATPLSWVAENTQ